MINLNKKIKLGQFYTITNPFNHKEFFNWYNNFSKTEIILEPYAGANNIINMLNEVNLGKYYKSYDIVPAHKNVIKQDVNKQFPIGHNVIITNPPYLAKNSAERKNIKIEMGIYDDLYKYCISLCLKNANFVAAIIPESFITANLFQERLYAWISLSYKMFNDTTCPVGLALWNPNITNDFKVYNNNKYLGLYSDLQYKKFYKIDILKCKFNKEKGKIGLIAIDNCKKNTIKFCKGTDITSTIKISSRSQTKISVKTKTNLELLIREANKILKSYRIKTKDVFLTSFKGLRADGKYRRRLDFKTAKYILNTAEYNLSLKNEFFEY